MLKLEHQSDTPLVAQIASGLRRLVEERKPTQGMKVPSIRQFARQHGVSPSTVARLALSGLVRLPHEGQIRAWILQTAYPRR